MWTARPLFLSSLSLSSALKGGRLAPEGDGDLLARPLSPLHREPHCVAYLESVETTVQVTAPLHGLSVDGNDDVPQHDAGERSVRGLEPARRRRVCRDVKHQNALPAKLREGLVRSQSDPQVRANNLAVGNDLFDDPTDGVHRDGETHADVCPPAGGIQDGGVYAYQLPFSVKQRASAVSRVDGGVRLDGAPDGSAALGLDHPAKATHNPGGHGVVEAEGVANGEDGLTHEESSTPSHTDWNEVSRVHALQGEDRNVLVLVEAHDGGGVGVLVDESHPDVRGPFDDVEVGDDVSLVVPNEPGSGAHRHLRDIQRPAHSSLLQVGDVHNRRGVLPKNRRYGILLGHEARRPARGR
mmetsp:Transcript_2128/g.7092  ORF Transcript_2128/g.7092 Transcript_2128/m.7092 type:complete len:354 (+) Transcript_2128:51-1112(+)